MKRRWILVVLTALALAAVVGIGAFMQIKLDGLQEPGRFETAVATGAKRFLISWSSREVIPPAPTNCRRASKKATNGTLRTVRCVTAPTATRPRISGGGFTRAPRISPAAEVQGSRSRIVLDYKKRHSEERNARVCRVESDEHIWNLVHYVRTLRGGASRPRRTEEPRRKRPWYTRGLRVTPPAPSATALVRRATTGGELPPFCPLCHVFPHTQDRRA